MKILLGLEMCNVWKYGSYEQDRKPKNCCIGNSASLTFVSNEVHILQYVQLQNF